MHSLRINEEEKSKGQLANPGSVSLFACLLTWCLTAVSAQIGHIVP